MSFIGEIRESLTAQIYELEALQSVYPKELIIADHGTLADINSFIESSCGDLPQRLEYAIDLSSNGETIELLVSLPVNYPREKPDVYVRIPLLDRAQQVLVNKALTEIIEHQEENEPCIYSLISWLQDNVEDYLKVSKASQEKQCNKKKEVREVDSMVFARYWIYSHHIYSKFKRRDIVDLAKENSLTGFCLAGKPGIVCIEGSFEDCEYYWQKVKSMNWHKILLKLIEKEEIKEKDEIKEMRKFADFLEISFPTSERHNDMGQLLKYLMEHECQHAFKELFGIEGKPASVSH